MASILSHVKGNRESDEPVNIHFMIVIGEYRLITPLKKMR